MLRGVTLSFCRRFLRRCRHGGVYKGRGYRAGGGGATVCLHHCPSTGQGCRRTPGDHCHTGARCATLQTTNRQEERDTSSVNNMFTDTNKQTRRSSDTAGRKPEDTTHESVQVRTLKRPLTDLLVSHRSPQVSVFIWNHQTKHMYIYINICQCTQPMYGVLLQLIDTDTTCVCTNTYNK